MINNRNNRYFVSSSFPILLIAVIVISLTTVTNTASSQQSITNTNTTANAAANATSTMSQEHQIHELHDLILSESIPLQGQLTSGDYLLLMDLTPFATSVETHGHIALKVPCNGNGQPQVTVVTGIAPKLNTLDIGTAINNGTLNGNQLDLSNEGKSCLYHAQIPQGITDIALVNTGNQTLSFTEGGYSVTITVHGTAIEHKDGF